MTVREQARSVRPHCYFGLKPGLGRVAIGLVCLTAYLGAGPGLAGKRIFLDPAARRRPAPPLSPHDGTGRKIPMAYYPQPGPAAARRR